MLEKLPQAEVRPSLWQRVERWRIGNPPQHLMKFSLIVLMGMLLWAAVISWSWPPSTSAINTSICCGALIVTVAGASRTAVMWRARLLVLSAEVLKPVSRMAIQKEWMLALARDIAPLVGLATIVLSVANNLGRNYSINWFGVGQNILQILPVAFVWTMGFASTLIVIQRTWLGLLLGVSVMYLQTAFFMVVLAVFFTPGVNTIPLKFPFLAFSFVASAILCYIMSRKWFRTEIGARQ